MGKFDRGTKRSGSGGFNRGFGGGRSFGGQRPSGRDGGRAAMYDAICSECGNECQVPFRPTGSKPVFCSNCFGAQADRGSRPSSFGGGRGDRGGRRERHRDMDRQMYDVVCGKCGKDCQVPFKPSSDKPVFCDDCFGKEKKVRDSGGRGSNEIMEQIKMLNKKIDQLVELVNSKLSTKNGEKTDVEVEVKESAKKIEKKVTEKVKKAAKKLEKKAKKAKK